MKFAMRNNFLTKATSGIAALAVLGSVFYFGYRVGSKQNNQPAIQNSEQPAVNGNIDLLWEGWDLVKKNYYNGGDITDQDLIYGAIEGLVKSLNDPYSVFFRPEDAKKFEEDISGSFGGIGAEIGIRNNQLVIVAPLKGNPAETAGLKSGDKILKIGDTFTNDLSIDEAVKLIRGEKGTTVALTIHRDDWDEPKEFSIVRDTILIPTIEWEMKEGNIAYVRLYNFNENASQEFYKTALDFLSKGTQGMVLDLRDNPGGFLEVAVNIAGWFIPRGEVVVRERFHSGFEQVFRANNNEALTSMPLVVLINSGSASASEILAGALRDNRGVKLIGEKSFGKGTVQELKNLSDGSTIKVSVAQWLLPKGSLIEKIGLTPDIEVSLTEEDIENEQDAQLEKALEVIRTESRKGPIFTL